MKKGIIFGTLLLISHPTAAAEVECLAEDEGRAILVSERQDNYFSLLQTREIQAKSGRKPPVSELAQQRVWLSQAYAEAVRECSSGEQRALKVYVEKLEEVLGEDYPGLFRLPWRFIKVTNTVEGGLPHTAGDAIVLSTAFMHYIRKTSDSIDRQLDVFNLLVHEQVHVLQRDHSAPFEQVYEKVFGFRRAAFVRGFESWLNTHQVINPDGVAYNWVWPVPATPHVIWPRILLQPGEKDVMSLGPNMAMVAIELAPVKEGYQVLSNGNGVPALDMLQANDIYTRSFPGVSSLYHPNEIAADFIAGLMIWDGFTYSLDGSENEMHWRQVRPWVKSLLGTE